MSMRIEVICGNCGDPIDISAYEIKDNGRIILTLNEEHVCSEDSEEEESEALHSQIDPLSSCDGEIEECIERIEARPPRVFYRCWKCGKDVTNKVIY